MKKDLFEVFKNGFTMARTLRYTRGFKPCRTLMDIETLKAMYEEWGERKSANAYGVKNIYIRRFRGGNFLVMELDRSEAETRIILHLEQHHLLFLAPQGLTRRKTRGKK